MADSIEIVTAENLMNLREMRIVDGKDEVGMFLVAGEKIISCYQVNRDMVVFTTKRVLVVCEQGITGKKNSCFSYPYSRISNLGIATAGLMDSDSEMKITFVDGTTLQFAFKSNVDIIRLYQAITELIL